MRMSSKRAAEYLGVSKRELQSLRYAGKVAFYRLGHRTVVYSVEDLDAFLKTCRVDSKVA